MKILFKLSLLFLFVSIIVSAEDKVIYEDSITASYIEDFLTQFPQVTNRISAYCLSKEIISSKVRWAKISIVKKKTGYFANFSIEMDVFKDKHKIYNVPLELNNVPLGKEQRQYDVLNRIEY